jgi:NAD(P)-dependent dehydrogenase (short-subunit alcohol dehydrogenase family)
VQGLSGKRALVTGAGRGIGLAAAERLAGEGARVALLDLDPGTGAGPGELRLVADVSDEDALAGAVGEAVGAFGGLDIVVANAAVQLTDREGPAHELDVDVWRRTLEVNLTGAFLTAKHGIRALRASGGGAVVCVGSAAGSVGIAPGLDAYSASKAGLAGLVRVMAADYAREGIRVNGVLPGIAETPMNAWWTQDARLRAEVLRPVPMARAAQPHEIAAVIAFLASDEASYVTGALWAVDGGLTAV